jgi:hypothetical protein
MLGPLRRQMDLFLRKVIHPQAHEKYRVLLKDNGVEIELGSIGVQFEGWHWGVDAVVPMREVDAEGSGRSSRHAAASPTTRRR